MSNPTLSLDDALEIDVVTEIITQFEFVQAYTKALEETTLTMLSETIDFTSAFERELMLHAMFRS